jgi:hypothetical protein
LRPIKKRKEKKEKRKKRKKNKTPLVGSTTGHAQCGRRFLRVLVPLAAFSERPQGPAWVRWAGPGWAGLGWAGRLRARALVAQLGFRTGTQSEGNLVTPGTAETGPCCAWGTFPSCTPGSLAGRFSGAQKVRPAFPTPSCGHRYRAGRDGRRGRGRAALPDLR